MENNTFDYNKNKSRVNIKPNDLILTFPRGDKSIYAEMKEVFADGGSTGEKYYRVYGNATKKGFDLYYFNNDNFEDYIGTYPTIELAKEQAEKDGYISMPMYMTRNYIFADGGELYDMSLPIGFYVKINPHYTATIRNLKSFESYLERKDELFGKEFGEITNVDKSASQEWVAELNRLIEKKKSELENKGIGNYKVGDEITLWRNQADRDGYVLAVDNNEMLVEYEMPNGTSALNIIDLTLPEYDKYNYNKNYKTISYDNARKSNKWSGKIDANRLINNPQGSSRRKSPTKRFADGGMAGLGEVSGMLPSPLPMSTITPMANGGEIKSLEKSLENAEKNYRKAILSEQVGIISPTELNRAKNKVDSIRAKVNEWYASRPIGKRMANGGGVEKVDNSNLLEVNISKQQKAVLKTIIPILNKKGLKLSYGVMVGKSPQSVIYDLKYQDGILHIPSEGFDGEYAPTWNDDKFYDRYSFENVLDSEDYANGGGVEIAEIPTRERTTITKPTTTPTTTPSKPDKDSPYKPKGIPKPKATKM